MKQSIFAIILLITASLTFTACDKNEDEPQTEPDKKTATRYIKRVTESNNSYTDYAYDNNNRLTKISDKPSSNQMIMEFSYTTAGKLETMTVTDSEGTHATSFVYNNKGVLINASPNNGMADLAYEYKNDKIIRVNAYVNIPNVGRKLMTKTEFDYTDDNVTEFREYTIDLMGGGNLELSEKVTYEYDNKKNPFYECNIAQAIVNIGYAQFASKNNCTKRTVVLSTSDDDPIGIYSTEFEYNTDNYPISANDDTSFTYYEN